MVTPGITSVQEGLGMAKADDLMRQQADHASSKEALRLAGASECWIIGITVLVAAIKGVRLPLV